MIKLIRFLSLDDAAERERFLKLESAHFFGEEIHRVLNLLEAGKFKLTHTFLSFVKEKYENFLLI